MTLSTANTAALKKSFIAMTGVKPLRCKSINGAMFLTVKAEDKAVAESFLKEFGLRRRDGKIICATDGVIADFPNLYVWEGAY